MSLWVRIGKTAKRPAIDSTALLVEARIEVPSGDSHVYVPDPDSPAVRLHHTLRTGVSYPADWAVVPGTLTPDGQPLGVVLITDIPCAAGAIARVRVIGLLCTDRERFLVAVLADDPKTEEITCWEQLALETRRAIEALFAAPSGTTSAGSSLRWLGSEPAAQALSEARLAARLAEADYHASRGRAPAWKAPVAAGSDAVGHSESEALVYQLPYRFQERAARLLLPTERILAFAPRPRGTGDGRRLFGRSDHREAGVLIVTDQQVLWLEDLPTSALDVESYGYVAQSIPLERLTAVAVRKDPAKAVVEFSAQASGGSHFSLAVAFPAVSAGVAEETARAARMFVECRGQIALMRLARLAEDNQDWLDLVERDDQATRSAVDGWRQELANILSEDETVVAKAIIPAWFALDGRPVAWLATTSRLLAVPAPHARARHQSWPAAAIGAVRLIDSVFESALAFEWWDGAKTVPERFVFPLVSAAQFLRLFVAVRQIMVGPAGFAPAAASGHQAQPTALR